MKNANFIADKLHELGFGTKVHGSDCVEVFLTNRKVSKMEVKTAVDENINTGNIKLRYSNFWNGILITWNKQENNG